LRTARRKDILVPFDAVLFVPRTREKMDLLLRCTYFGVLMKA